MEYGFHGSPPRVGPLLWVGFAKAMENRGDGFPINPISDDNFQHPDMQNTCHLCCVYVCVCWMLLCPSTLVVGSLVSLTKCVCWMPVVYLLRLLFSPADHVLRWGVCFLEKEARVVFFVAAAVSVHFVICGIEEWPSLCPQQITQYEFWGRSSAGSWARWCPGQRSAYKSDWDACCTLRATNVPSSASTTCEPCCAAAIAWTRCLCAVHEEVRSPLA